METSVHHRKRGTARLLRLTVGLTVALVLTGCAESDNSGDGATTQVTATSNTSAEDTASTASTASIGANPEVIAGLFDDGALTTAATVVDCTLANGSETACYQLQVQSLPATLDTDGPYCPATAADQGGIWVWDGAEPGLYALDAGFWALVEAQGFEFLDADGNISVTDPGGGGGGGGVTTANSCLEATADGSFHLEVLLPVQPETLDTPSNIGTVSQVGLALDGATIFGDAPSVADRGGLPALDACGGHIDPSGYYHWHFGAESIQVNLDDAGAQVVCAIAQDTEALIGFASDGYPIYGPEEGGAVPADLDACSGHIGDTEHFGEVYHYHLTFDSPNLPPCLMGATAVNTLFSPDNPDASLPGGGGPGSGGPPAGGRPPGG